MPYGGAECAAEPPPHEAVATIDVAISSHGSIAEEALFEPSPLSTDTPSTPFYPVTPLFVYPSTMQLPLSPLLLPRIFAQLRQRPVVPLPAVAVTAVDDGSTPPHCAMRGYPNGDRRTCYIIASLQLLFSLPCFTSGVEQLSTTSL